MSPETYLQQKLKHCSEYILSDADNLHIKNKGLRDFLYAQVTRKKFRRIALHEKAQKTVETALDYCIPKQLPLQVRFRFGGYKLWRLPTSPEVDWAEFFTIAHFAEYLAPLVAAYQPGVKLLFMSDDMFVQPMNNVPASSTEAYYRSFVALTQEFRKYFPKNFDIEMIRHSSLYTTREQWVKELISKIHEIRSTWKKELTPDKLKRQLATSRLNVKWDGVQDLTGLSEDQKEAYIERGALFHEALVRVPTIRSFSDGNPNMFAISCVPLPSVIVLGTTKSSIAKFWVGTGVLENRDGVFYDRILSPGQFDEMKKEIADEHRISFLPLRNFSRITLFNKGFTFFG